MTTDNKLPDATQTEGQAFAGGQSGQTDATAADAPAQATEIDWKGQVEALTARLEKAEAAANTNAGRFQANKVLADEIGAIRDEIGAIGKTQAATMTVIAKGLSVNDVENLPGEVARVQSEAATERARARYEASFDAIEQQMHQMALSEDGTPIIDINAGSEFAEVRSDYLRAKDANDLAGGTLALTKGYSVIRQVERAKGKADLESVKKTSAEATEKALSDAGVHDLDTGAGGGGTAAATMDLDTWRALPPAERQKHKLVASSS